MSKDTQKTSNSSGFLVQGSILAIAGIIVRLIGLLYKIFQEVFRLRSPCGLCGHP